MLALTHARPRVSLPPLPVGVRDLLPAWHEDERRTYLYDPTGQLWTVDDDGAAAPVSADVALPGGVSSVYQHRVLFTFCRARRRLLVAVVGYDTLGVGVIEDGRMVTLQTRGAIASARSDALAYDVDAGALLHVVGQRDTGVARTDERADRGGLTVRALGVDDVWRDVSPPLARAGTMNTYAAWEPRRKLVILDDGSNHCFSFDGAAFVDHGRFPTFVWGPNQLFAGHDGRLVFLQRKREHLDFDCLAWRFDDDGWRPLRADGLDTFGGGYVHPLRNETRVFGASFGAGRRGAVWARVDGDALVEAAAPVLWGAGGTVSGPPVVWSRPHPPATTIANDALLRAHRAVAVTPADAALGTDAAPSPPFCAVVGSRAGVFGVAFDGAVFVRGAGGAWTARTPAPRGFALRTRTNAGVDDEGTVVVVGGRETAISREINDAWLLGPSSARTFKPKGTLPWRAIVDGVACFDGAARAWVMSGGVQKDFRKNTGLWVFDEKTCRAVDGLAYTTVSLLAFDAASALTFAITRPEYGMGPAQLCALTGDALVVVDDLDLDVDAAFAYDADRRVVWAVGSGVCAFVDVGAALDAAATVTSTPPSKKASTKKAPKKKAPKKR